MYVIRTISWRLSWLDLMRACRSSREGGCLLINSGALIGQSTVPKLLLSNVWK